MCQWARAPCPFAASRPRTDRVTCSKAVGRTGPVVDSTSYEPCVSLYEPCVSLHTRRTLCAPPRTFSGASPQWHAHWQLRMARALAAAAAVSALCAKYWRSSIEHSSVFLRGRHGRRCARRYWRDYLFPDDFGSFFSVTESKANGQMDKDNKKQNTLQVDKFPHNH